jgi:GNAT superfamily N-acetyltransferase
MLTHPTTECAAGGHPDAIHECRSGDLVVSTDRARLDLGVIHGFLSRSYWARGIPRETVERSIRHSICFGAFDAGRQVGFARVISDRATYAYVADVFVLESHRGRGVSKRIMDCITSHPDLQNLRLWTLFTRDAHGLYRQSGFRESRYPDRLMEKRRDQAYASPAGPVSR